jgi:hypothetical protein
VTKNPNPPLKKNSANFNALYINPNQTHIEFNLIDEIKSIPLQKIETCCVLEILVQPFAQYCQPILFIPGNTIPLLKNQTKKRKLHTIQNSTS